MKAGKKYILLFLMACASCFLYGQTRNSNLYIDNLEKGDTLKVSIKFFVNRNEAKEEVLIYINESKHYQASLNTDSIKNQKIELSTAMIKTIKMFEIALRKQCLKSNIPLYLHSLAEYEIYYKKGSISYFSKEEYYSLCEDILKNKDSVTN